MLSPATRPLVLLIEDSDDDVFFFSRTLKKSGIPCTLKHLKDGNAAIRYLGEAFVHPESESTPAPDFIFLDLKLPTYSGFEILEWIRKQPAQKAQVTILSGSDHRGDFDRAKALGAAGYLVKPVTVEQLRLQLQSWQGQRTEPADAT